MGDIMINKQGLIFLTLTSLILVLSVYYVTMPNELLLTTNSSYIKDEQENTSNEKNKVVINESSIIETMRSLLNEERMEELSKLKDKLTKKEISLDEKNNAYDEIQSMNKIEAMEEDIEKIIKDELKLDSFVKVVDDVIEVVIQSEKHDTNLAVKIMSLIEKTYKGMYISVNFKA